MANNDKVDKLTDSLNSYMIATTKQTAESRAYLKTLFKLVEENTTSCKENTTTCKEVLISTTRFEAKLENLEENAVRKIDSLSLENNGLNKRIHALELINANANGQRVGEGLKERRVFTAWQKTLGAITLIVGLFSIAYTIAAGE